MYPKIMLKDPSGFRSQPSKAGATGCPLEYDNCALATLSVNTIPVPRHAIARPLRATTRKNIVICLDKSNDVPLTPSLPLSLVSSRHALESGEGKSSDGQGTANSEAPHRKFSKVRPLGRKRLCGKVCGSGRVTRDSENAGSPKPLDLSTDRRR